MEARRKPGQCDLNRRLCHKRTAWTGVLFQARRKDFRLRQQCLYRGHSHTKSTMASFPEWHKVQSCHNSNRLNERSSSSSNSSNSSSGSSYNKNNDDDDNDDNDEDIERCNSRFFSVYSQPHELSPTHTHTSSQGSIVCKSGTTHQALIS